MCNDSTIADQHGDKVGEEELRKAHRLDQANDGVLI